MFLLVGCGTIEEPPMTAPSIIDTENPDNGDSNGSGNNNDDSNDETQEENNNNGSNNGNNSNVSGPVEVEVEFVVSLVNNEKLFIPEEEITVIWMDDYSRYEAVIGEDGYAKKMLDGDFNVILDKAPEGYTYNPNIYTASNGSYLSTTF